MSDKVDESIENQCAHEDAPDMAVTLEKSTCFLLRVIKILREYTAREQKGFKKFMCSRK